MTLKLIGRSSAGERYRRRKDTRGRSKSAKTRREGRGEEVSGQPWWKNSNGWPLNAVVGVVSRSRIRLRGLKIDCYTEPRLASPPDYSMRHCRGVVHEGLQDPGVERINRKQGAGGPRGLVGLGQWTCGPLPLQQVYISSHSKCDGGADRRRRLRRRAAVATDL